MPDIDAKFGNIWTTLRKKHLFTPGHDVSNLFEKLSDISRVLNVDEYKEALMSIFSNENSEKVRVIDILVVPDYERILSRMLDSHLGNYARGKVLNANFFQLSQ